MGLVTIALASISADSRAGFGQIDARLPFDAGEQLTYRITVDKLRASGRGTMWIEGPTEFRGSTTLLLRSDIQVGLGPLKAIDRSESWLDTQLMAALRYQKRQRHLLSRASEDVEMYPAERRWESSNGEAGTSVTEAPLDELSFIYFVRTLALDTSYTLDRHYDPNRNPVSVRGLGRDTVRVPAGEFPVVIAEMRVKDPRHFAGEGVIRLFLSDDVHRLPVRIESALPGVGNATFSLETYVLGTGRRVVSAR